jgi:hypothetical protein
VEGTGHERVVVHRIAEYYELGATQAVPRRAQTSGLDDGSSHQCHRVHVDSGLGGADVDRCADVIGDGECLRNRCDQCRAAAGHALLHQCRKAAEEIHPDLFCGAVEIFGHQHVGVCGGALRDQRDRRHGDALVDDRNAVFRSNFFAGTDQILGEPADLVVSFRCRHGKIGMGTIAQADAHGDGANVEILHLHHADGFDDFLGEVTADAHAGSRVRYDA